MEISLALAASLKEQAAGVFCPKVGRMPKRCGWAPLGMVKSYQRTALFPPSWEGRELLPTQKWVRRRWVVYPLGKGGPKVSVLEAYSGQGWDGPAKWEFLVGKPGEADPIRVIPGVGPSLSAQISEEIRNLG